MSAEASGSTGKRTPFIVITPHRGLRSINWRELWKSREVGWILAMRHVRIRYKQTVLGVAWAVVKPLVTMGIFIVIFGKVARIPTAGIPRALFYFSGILPWTLFSDITTRATGSLVANQRLLTKVYMPRLWIPFSAAGPAVMDFLIAVVLLLPMMGWFAYHGADIRLTWTALLAPVIIAMILVFACGIGAFFSAMQVRFRDVGLAIKFFIQILMYMTPVIYPIEVLEKKFPDYFWIAFLNPMTGLVHAFRGTLLGQPVYWEYAWISLAVAAASVIFGTWFFRQVEHEFADII